MDTIVLGQGYS